ncbi:MAG: hypothetical protein RJA70_4168 [Pseudomonadota bacterium]|jgi:uncharacterized small protein (TIGR04563 family)
MVSGKRESAKQSLYFPFDMLEEMQEEAKRLDRSLSWVVQRAWATARAEVRQMPDSEGQSSSE